MTPEQVLSYPARVLSQVQRESYFERGYVLAERIVPDRWLERLQAATAELTERSRALTDSNPMFDLEDGHSAETPRLRRVTNTNEAHPTFWAYISESLVTDIAADLVGPNVKFMDSNFNFKSAGGGHRGAVAPGRAIHPAYQLQPSLDRHHAGGCRTRSGTDGGSSRQSRR